MKNKLSFLSFLLLVSYAVSAQNCFILDKGYKIKLSAYNYSPTVTETKGWSKMKPDKKAILINEYNAKVLAGTKPAASSSTYDMYIKDVIQGNPSQMISAMMISGTEYKFTSFCKNDTGYFYRTVGPVYYATNGDTVGAGFNGVQIIPMNLKVGDRLQSYEDISTLVIGSKSYTDKQKVLEGYRKIETIERNTTHLNQQTLQWEKGDWNVTKYEEVWKDVDVQVLENLSLNNHTIHNVNAVVDRTEDIVMDGKTYKAYVIESELWIQAGFESTFAADNAKWLKHREKFQNRLENIAEKKLVKSKFLNEDGYYVTYLTEWFIPGMAVVKVVTYNSDGLITTVTSWNDIK
jgi:hypothetical protein